MKTMLVLIAAGVVFSTGCRPAGSAAAQNAAGVGEQRAAQAPMEQIVPEGARANAEWGEQQRRMHEQLEAQDRQLERADALQKQREDQVLRFDRILDKWEEQARRYDLILDAMEKQTRDKL